MDEVTNYNRKLKRAKLAVLSGWEGWCCSLHCQSERVCELMYEEEELAPSSFPFSCPEIHTSRLTLQGYEIQTAENKQNDALSVV